MLFYSIYRYVKLKYVNFKTYFVFFFKSSCGIELILHTKKLPDLSEDLNSLIVKATQSPLVMKTVSYS